MTIREFNKSDLDACARLLIETYNRPPWDDTWTLETASNYIQEFMSYGRFVGFVVVIDNEIIGATFLREKTWMDVSELYMDEFHISPCQQGKGLGKALFAHVEAYAKENKLAGITLLTDKQKPAFEFYQNVGMAKSQSTIFMFKIIQ